MLASTTQDFSQILQLLQRQQYSTKMVENLINDLMDLAKIENNKFKLYESYYSLPNTISETLEMMSFMAQQKSIKLKGCVESRQHLKLISNIYGDQGRIK